MANAVATTLHDVPDKLLALILARLVASPLCLVHVAATCKRWRRIMARPGFFAGMIRGPHPRPVAGNYYNCAPLLDIVFVPNPTSPSQQRAVSSHKFSLDFLPGGARSWEVIDSSRSLVLLAKKKKSGWMRHCFPDLVVCEPATQRYKLVPRMEEMKHNRCLGTYLVNPYRSTKHNPNGYLRVVDVMTTFKVACVVYEGYDGVSDDIGCATTCFFSRNIMKRGISGPHSWYADKRRKIGYDVVLHSTDSLRFVGYAGGTLLWSIRGDATQLVTATGGIQLVPDNFKGNVLRVVDSGRRGYIMLFCLEGSNLQVFEKLSYLYGWELHKSIELIEATCGLVGRVLDFVL